MSDTAHTLRARARDVSRVASLTCVRAWRARSCVRAPLVPAEPCAAVADPTLGSLASFRFAGNFTTRGTTIVDPTSLVATYGCLPAPVTMPATLRFTSVAIQLSAKNVSCAPFVIARFFSPRAHVAGRRSPVASSAILEREQLGCAAILAVVRRSVGAGCAGLCLPRVSLCRLSAASCRTTARQAG